MTFACPGQAGYECVLKAAGDTVGLAQDVELEMSADEIETTTRLANGWKAFIQGLKEFTASVDLLWVITNAQLKALRDAFLAGTNIEAQFLDKDGNGFKGTVFLTGLRFGQPISDGVVMPVTMRGCGPIEVVGSAS